MNIAPLTPEPANACAFVGETTMSFLLAPSLSRQGERQVWVDCHPDP